MSVLFRSVSIPSSNGTHTVYGYAFIPLGNRPRGIVQLLHGLHGHVFKYPYCIGRLVEAGFAVYAQDALGQGLTGERAGDMGCPLLPDGYENFIEDERRLHDLAVSEYPGLPYFLLGHSWGTMRARAYAAKYGDDLDGLILHGPVAGLAIHDELAANADFWAAVEAADVRDPAGAWGSKPFGDVNRRIKDPITPNAWSTHDPTVYYDQCADPLACKEMSLKFFGSMIALARDIAADESAAAIPARVKTAILLGDDDPLCNYGEGAFHLRNQLIDSGKETEIFVYRGMRHDMLRDVNRETVVNDILAFCQRVAEEKP